MRRGLRLLSIVTVMMLGLVAANWSGGVVRAQESTPAAGEMEPEGVGFEPIGFAEGVALPSPADLFAVRFSLEPGAGFPLDPNDPTGGLVIVESGIFTITVEQAWTVSRGAAVQQAMATPEGGDMAGVIEAIAVGQLATLGPGDVAYIPGNVAGEVRNDGQEEAVGLVILVGEAGTMSEGEAAATPTS
jgi:hypothetical protein